VAFSAMGATRCCWWSGGDVSSNETPSIEEEGMHRLQVYIIHLLTALSSYCSEGIEPRVCHFACTYACATGAGIGEP